MQQNFLPTIFVLLLLLVAFLGTFALKCKEGAGFGLVNSTAVECHNTNNYSFCIQVDCKTNNKEYPLYQRFGCTTGSVRGDCTAMVQALADMDAFAMEGWSCTCYTDQTGVEPLNAREAPHTVILVNVMEKNGSGSLLRVGIASVIAAALAAIFAVTAL